MILAPAAVGRNIRSVVEPDKEPHHQIDKCHFGDAADPPFAHHQIDICIFGDEGLSLYLHHQIDICHFGDVGFLAKRCTI